MKGPDAFPGQNMLGVHKHWLDKQGLVKNNLMKNKAFHQKYIASYLFFTNTSFSSRLHPEKIVFVQNQESKVRLSLELRIFMKKVVCGEVDFNDYFNPPTWSPGWSWGSGYFLVDPLRTSTPCGEEGAIF